MAVDVNGMKELLSEIEEMFDTQNLRKAQKIAIKKGGELMLEEMKSQAPRASYGSKSSYRYLTSSVFYDEGQAKAKIGINSSNFNLCRGLFFHQLGFKSHAPDDFMGRAFTSKKDSAFDTIKDELERYLVK